MWMISHPADREALAFQSADRALPDSPRGLPPASHAIATLTA
jgi:hypothetical protein